MTELPEHPPAARPSPSSALVAADALVAMAPTLRIALVFLGIVSCLHPLLGNERAPLIALARLFAFSLTAWVVPGLLRAAAAGLELFQAQVAATERLAEAVVGLTEVPRRGPAPEEPAPAAPLTGPAVDQDSRLTLLADIRVAIREARWVKAEALIQAFADAHPDDVAASRVTADLAVARQEAVEGLHARIDAVREANEPGQVLEAHEELALLLSPHARRDLDRSLARWMMMQVQKRLRNGLISLDAVTLATRVTEAFGATPEAASLRAALPTLRRSAGLCARCGQPYRGVEDACPACVANAYAPAPPRDDDLDGLAGPPDGADGDEFDPERF